MKRIVWDILMLAVFLAVMSFHFLPKMLHEVLGVALPLLAVMHLIWNRRWFAALLQGKWGARRLLSGAINFLLMASLLAILVTGVCISNHLFKGIVPLDLARNITIHQIHVSMPFLMLILIGLHLGLHWRAWWQWLKNACGWQGNTIAYRLLTKGTALAICGLGIYGSFQNRVGDHILLKHIFASPATSEPGGIYVLLLLSILGMYAVLFCIWQGWAEHKKNRTEETI